MSIHAYDSSWKEITTVQAKDAGSWKTPSSIQIKSSDVWTEVWPVATPPPANMIILYQTDSQFSGLNTSAFANSDSRFLLSANSSIGSTLGTSAHDGSDHGTKTQSMGYVANAQINTTTPFVLRATTASSHKHNNISHSHGGSTDVVPSYFNLIPRIGGDYIGAGAVFLSYDALVWSEWTLITSYVTRYLRLVNSQASIGTGGSATHTHPNGSSTSSTYSTTTHQYAGPGGTYYRDHYHVTTHTMSVGSNNPQYANSHFYSVDSDLPDFGALPSGTVAFLNDTSIPSGWSYLSTFLGKIPKSVTSGTGTGGGDSHSHTCNNNMGLTGSTQYTAGNTVPSVRAVPTNTADHSLSTITDHISSNSIPNSINAYPIVKD